MEVIFSGLIVHNHHWEHFVATNLDFYLCFAIRTWRSSKAYIESETCFGMHGGRPNNFLDGRPYLGQAFYTRLFFYSCLGRPSWTSLELILWYTISCPLVHGSSREMCTLASFFGHMYLNQRLGVPLVMIPLVTGHVNSFFWGACHVAAFGWLCRFRC